jgi:hypothetical protein
LVSGRRQEYMHVKNRFQSLLEGRLANRGLEPFHSTSTAYTKIMFEAKYEYVRINIIAIPHNINNPFSSKYFKAKNNQG